MENRIRKYIEQQNMLQNGDTVVVGVSGGPDSICLLYVLFLLKDTFQIHLVCAHIDHQTRLGESKEDAKFVRMICDQYKIPFECRTVDVKRLAKERKMNFHQVARNCRYMFFKEVMQKYGAEKLALAHHSEDLAETFMMRLVKQSPYGGWLTLSPKRVFAEGMLIRPLMELTKQEILNYLQQKNLDYRVDYSNDETYYTRNRFRKNIMPFVYQENPNFISGLFRTQQDLLADEAYLMAQTEQACKEVIRTQKADEVILDRNTLVNLPRSLQRRVIRVVLEYLYFYRKSSFSHAYISDILTLLSHQKGYLELRLADEIYVTVDYISVRIGVGLPRESGPYEIMIPAVGTYDLPNGGTLRVTEHAYRPDKELKNLYWIGAEHIKFPYIIRTRRPNDKIALINHAGHKKINRLFIDEKVPLHKRASWPLLIGQDGKILWVPLLKKVRLPESIEQQKVFYVFQYITRETEEEQS